MGLYKRRLIHLHSPTTIEDIRDKTICQDVFEAVQYLPNNSAKLFADPPCNLTTAFNQQSFQQISLEKYEEWLDSWLFKILSLLEPTASIYICGKTESLF
jgi:site-specific DNA-methyltransferase (adenine-specific)